MRESVQAQEALQGERGAGGSGGCAVLRRRGGSGGVAFRRRSLEAQRGAERRAGEALRLERGADPLQGGKEALERLEAALRLRSREAQRGTQPQERR